MKMAPPKHRPRENVEDISLLRKPITLHGKPVEQILNSIHYGSPELRFLLLEECDMIFECKICRALFRDLPNFISHKRRYCLKSYSNDNHHRIAAVPEERVVVVHPEPVDGLSRSNVKSQPSAQAQSSSTREGSEAKVLRSCVKDTDKSPTDDIEFYKRAEEKLRRQKEHAKAIRINTTDIPTNSNAVFIDVQTVPSNFHDRHAPVPCTDKMSGKYSKKSVNRKDGEKIKFSDDVQKQGEKSGLKGKAVDKMNVNSDGLTNTLMNELKAIQNKIRNKAQNLKSDKIEKPHWAISGKVIVSSSLTPEPLAEQNSSEPKVDQKVSGDNAVQFSQNSLPEITKPDIIGIESDRESMSLSKASNLNDAGLEMRKVAELGLQKVKRKCTKSLICSKCASIFSSLRSLQFHIKTTHTVRRFFPCPCCSNVYYYFHACTRHLRINHNKSKKQIEALKPEMKSKSFSKLLDAQDSLIQTRRGVLGSRQSMRAKDSRLNKKANNASYVYSVIKQGKKLSAKNDPALGEQVNGASNSNISKQEMQTDCKSMKKEALEAPPVNNEHNSKLKSLLEKFASSTDSRLEDKSCDDVAAQIQRCDKCLRFFGRKATFENHAKVCERNVFHDSPKSIEFKASNDDMVNDENLPSISTRNKDKGALHLNSNDSISSQSIQTLNYSHKNDDTVDGDYNSRQTKCMERNTKIKNDKNETNSGLVFYSKPSRKSTPFKINTSERKSANVGSDAVLNSRGIVDKEAKCEEVNFDDTESTKSSESSFTVTRNRSKSGLNNVNDKEMNGIVQEADGERHLTNDEPDGDKTDHVKTSQNTEAINSNIVERPKRKRKIPSRNADASEFFQKIHRVNIDNNEDSSSEKKTKNCLSNKSVVASSSIRRNITTDLRHSKRRGVRKDDKAPRKRVNANKIFVLNEKKLECYNSSKIDKYIDIKKKMCLKCGAKFSFPHNLKRHIVRLHLNWSRFKCKLCNFNSFDKSECNTHIIRRHKDESKLKGNHYFNTLIIDLAKKGSKEMSMKKQETFQANKIQEESETNIYKNQNAVKVPRLHERLLENQNSIINNLRKSKIQQALEESKTQTSTKSSLSVNDDLEKVIRTSPAATSSSASNNRNRINSESSLEKRNSVNLEMAPPPLVKSSEVAANTKCSNSSITPNSTASVSVQNPLLRRFQVLPYFNISTRNSPRVFDTTPYPRESTNVIGDFNGDLNLSNDKSDCHPSLSTPATVGQRDSKPNYSVLDTVDMVSVKTNPVTETQLSSQVKLSETNDDENGGDNHQEMTDVVVVSESDIK